MITEVGGTVGDIESLPFLEACRQVRHDVGRDHCFFLHVSLVPYLAPSGELKTKPTQHSVAALRNIGIQPDALVCRADREIPEDLKRKIGLMCDVDTEAVIACPDARSIYDIPKVLHGEALDAYVVRRLGLPFRDVDWTVWGDLLDRVHNPSEIVRIAVVGKYIDLPDAYLSVTEALRAGGFAHRAKVEIVWVASDDAQTASGAASVLSDVDGVLIPGGFGIRGIEGKVGAIEYARTRGVPLLGLCLGLQCMVIEGARHLAGITDAGSSEFDENTQHPVISTMADQRDVVAGERDMGGTMRLGAYPAKLKPGSQVAKAYGTTEVSERHRHRYEVNNAYRKQLSDAGLVFSGTSPDDRLVEFVELPAERAPVLRRHPGAPRAEEPPDPAAPAVQRVRQGRRGPQGRRAAAGRAARSPGGGPMTAPGEHEFSVASSRDVHIGRVVGLRIDEVVMPDGNTATREVIEHLGAVAIVALDDDQQVTLIHQYRHPIGHRLWELPAGLIDHLGEDPVGTAKRELVEEVGLAAADWVTLVDVAASPGFTDEVVRVFLARGLSDVDRDVLGEEEADLVIRKFPLAEAVRMALAGELINGAHGVRRAGRARGRHRRRRGAPGRRAVGGPPDGVRQAQGSLSRSAASRFRGAADGPGHPGRRCSGA